jgi:hypothetical protein
MSFLKKILLWGTLAALLYILLSYHFIFFGKEVKLLRKSKYTLEYTFYNTTGKSNRSILENDDLRNDGIADLLVEMGVMSEEERERIMSKFEEEAYY